MSKMKSCQVAAAPPEDAKRASPYVAGSALSFVGRGVARNHVVMAWYLPGRRPSIGQSRFTITHRRLALLPMLEAAGIATSRAVDIETLAERLREEAVRIGGFRETLIIIAASGQVPA